VDTDGDTGLNIQYKMIYHICGYCYAMGQGVKMSYIILCRIGQGVDISCIVVNVMQNGTRSILCQVR